jgi:hypothetical protein
MKAEQRLDPGFERFCEEQFRRFVDEKTQRTRQQLEELKPLDAQTDRLIANVLVQRPRRRMLAHELADHLSRDARPDESEGAYRQFPYAELAFDIATGFFKTDGCLGVYWLRMELEPLRLPLRITPNLLRELAQPYGKHLAEAVWNPDFQRKVTAQLILPVDPARAWLRDADKPDLPPIFRAEGELVAADSAICAKSDLKVETDEMGPLAPMPQAPGTPAVCGQGQKHLLTPQALPVAVRAPKAIRDSSSGVALKLRDLLREMAVEAGKSRKDADWSLRRILQGYRNIEDAKVGDLRQQRFRNGLHNNPKVAGPCSYPREFAVLIVRCTRLTRVGMTEEQAIELAKTAKFDALSRAEQRAVEQLTGENSAAANPYVERQATALAREVRKVWPTTAAQKRHRRPGRPPGWQPKVIPPRNPDERIRVPISYPEAVSIVLPPIERLIGRPVQPSIRGRKHKKEPSSVGLTAVVLGLQLIKLKGKVSEADLESIRRAVARAHRKGC